MVINETDFDPEVFSTLALTMLPLLLWSAFWKALALWHAARKGSAGWFLALAVFNTLGILELFYLYRNGKLRPGKLFNK